MTDQLKFIDPDPTYSTWLRFFMRFDNGIR